MVYFADADPIFRGPPKHAKEPVFFSPEPVEEEAEDYQRRVAEAGYALPSLASVPLLSGDVTTGALGFIKFGIKDWSPEELNALKAIASLFAQVQPGWSPKDQLRYLAEHDDLTGLSNRRALLAHLDERLRTGRPGPVSALFLDLDRLKAINDYLGHHAGDWFIRTFAERLREETGEADVIARLGGGDVSWWFPRLRWVPPRPSRWRTGCKHCCVNALQSVAKCSPAQSVSAFALGSRDATPPPICCAAADQAVLNAKNAGGNKSRSSPTRCH